MKSKATSLVFFIGLILLLDQGVKRSMLSKNINLFGSIDINSSSNPLGPFSSPIFNNTELIVLLAILLLFSIYKYFQPINTYFRAGLIAVIGGGMSNLVDRVLNKAVIDVFSYKNIFFFNLADVFLFSGLILILMSLLKQKD